MELSSSRKSVPPFAFSKSPFRSKAPVKLPFTVPNNVLSIKVGGMAEQFTDKKGIFSLWLECVHMDWAIISFPVPVSPTIKTEVFVFAIFRIFSFCLHSSEF